jgi:hypothetical protein
MDKKIEYNPSWGICKPIRNGCEYEIAKIICKATHNAELKHCEIICNVDCTKYGKAIKEAGYRKGSDTARDVIGDLAELIINHSGRLTLEDLYEIAEKYGVKVG